MTEPEVALAREAVACKHWEWMPGMLTTCGLRVLEGGYGGVIGYCSSGIVDEGRDDYLPDLDDDATKGALLGLVRRAWGCDDHRRLTIEPAGAGWCVVVRNGRHRPPSRAQPGWDLDRVAHPPYRNSPRVFLDEYPTDEAALVAALKAAP